MIFKMYNCDFGVKIGVTSYDFRDVAEVQIENGQRNTLTRGANAKNIEGLAYIEGIKEPKKWTTSALALSAALHAVLVTAYNEQTRLEVYAIDRTDGSSKMAKKAILANYPQQLTLDESAESMNVSLEFVSFDLTENHKS